ncbi:hypothetical protein LCGC14_0940740 [marine sediment metagenome]|uniref:Uncharacterized protein n=1 Tax=marine sediment metagenome TaxID=412755 RepID=A0A0F9NK51_9ZZZZ
MKQTRQSKKRDIPESLLPGRIKQAPEVDGGYAVRESEPRNQGLRRNK